MNKQYDAQQKDIKALKAEINKLRPIESAAQSVRYAPRRQAAMRAPPPYRPVLTRGMLPASTWQVRQKEKQLKELQPGGASHNPRPFVDKKKFSFRFPPSPRCAPEVIELEGVAHGYGKSTLFSDIDLCIEKGDRIAILGANGAGKSTTHAPLLSTWPLLSSSNSPSPRRRRST